MLICCIYNRIHSPSKTSTTANKCTIQKVNTKQGLWEMGEHKQGATKAH